MTGMQKLRYAIALFLTISISAQAWGQDAQESTDGTSMPEKQFVVSVGLGGLWQPRYPGADDYLLSPFPIITFDRLFVPGFGQVVDGKTKTRGFGFYPFFSFIGERKASDSPDLIGTKPVDWAVEAGLGVRYRYDWIRGFAEIRQGFNGYSGQYGTLGLDFIVEPTERMELIFGPRVNFGSEGYTDTYFGVTAAEAGAAGSKLVAYNPKAGLNSAGVAARVKYALNEKTFLHVSAGWDKFVGDVADSPIVQLGSEDQFTLGIGLSYRLDFNAFD